MELRQLLAIIWRRKWIGIIVFLSFVMGIMGISLTVTPTYDSTAQILLRPSQGADSLLKALGLPSGAFGRSSLSDKEVSTLITIATIKPLADKVAEDLKLQRERVRAKIIKAIPFAAGILKKVGVDVAEMVKPVTGEDLVNKSIIASIFPRPYVSVEQYGETNIVEIEATSQDPQEAKDIAEAMANIFMETEREMVAKDFDTVVAVLEKNLASIRQDYDLALEKAETFQQKEHFISIDTEISSVVERLLELTIAREELQVTIDRTMASIEDSRRQLKDIPQFRKNSEQVSKNDLIQTAKESLQTLYLELAASKTRYKSNHPDIIDIQNKIAYLKTVINSETLKIFSSETMTIDPVYQALTSEIAVYYTSLAADNAQKDALNQLLEKYKKRLLKLSSTIKESAKIDLDLLVSKTLAQSFSSYARSIELARNASLSNIMMVAAPEVPLKTDKRHSHPSHGINFIIAVFLGTFFGFMAMLIIEYVDDTIYSPENVKNIENTRLLGCIAKVKSGKKHQHPTLLNTPSLTGFFKRIHLEMGFLNPENQPCRLGVTSLFEKEGKRFFAVNFGILKAWQGYRVIIVETDFHNPGLHKWFDIENHTGLTKYLAGKVDLHETIQPSGISGLDIITAGPGTNGIEAVSTSEKFLGISKKLGQSHDLVILVTAPAFMVTETFNQIAVQEETIVILESGRIRKAYFEEFLTLTEKGKIPLIGTVLNKQAGMRYHYVRYDMNPLEVLRNFLGNIRHFWKKRLHR